MAEVEVAPAATAATQVKATKKKTTPKAKKVGPTVGDMIVKAVSDSKERGGISLPAIKKILLSEGYDVEKNNARVKNAVKSLLAKGTLVNSKGSGASGSFKISKEVKPAAKKVAAPKAKKPAVKKPSTPKKTTPKKAKKPAVKSSSAKKASPKKPAAAKKTKEAIKKAVTKKTPTKKVVTKKTTTKSPKKAPKPAAKKSPAKKATKKAAPKKK